MAAAPVGGLCSHQQCVQHCLRRLGISPTDLHSHRTCRWLMTETLTSPVLHCTALYCTVLYCTVPPFLGTADPSIDGILIQLPLPRHLDEEAVMEFLWIPRRTWTGSTPEHGPYADEGPGTTICAGHTSGSGGAAVSLCFSISRQDCCHPGGQQHCGHPLAALLRDAGAALVTTCHRVSYQQLSRAMVL